MHTNKAVEALKLNFIILILLSFIFIQGCGKKDTTGDKTVSKSDKTSTKDDNISLDKPFHVIFDISGTSKGTVDAYYNGKKARSTSSIDIQGQKMSATAYFDSDNKIMYMINEIGGTKTGMKMDMKAMETKNFGDNVDITNFKDKLKEMDKIGSEEILGRQCDIYKSKDGKYQISVYKETIPLKFSSGEGKMVLVATKLETDVKVTDDMFTPPSDVDYKDASGLMKDMKNMKSYEDKSKEMEDVLKKYKK